MKKVIYLEEKNDSNLVGLSGNNVDLFEKGNFLRKISWKRKMKKVTYLFPFGREKKNWKIYLHTANWKKTCSDSLTVEFSGGSPLVLRRNLEEKN